LLSAAVTVLLWSGATAPASAGQVVLNVWDGADYGAVRALHRDGRLPRLASLGPLRQLTAVVSCVGARCQHGRTKDQHATMLTGRTAGEHGVWGNDSPGPVPAGLTVFERLRVARPGMRIAFLSGKCRNVGPETFANAVPAIDVLMACTPGGHGYRPEAVAAEAARLAALWAGQDFLIFVHFSEPDHSGHRFGVESARYRAAIAADDALLGEILDAAPGAQAIVLGDHGFGTLNLMNGRAKSREHDAHTPATFVAGVPDNLYMDEVAAAVEAAALR